MFVTLVVMLCNTMPGPQLCLEEIVADSSQGLTMHSCEIGGQIGVLQWMSQSKYRNNWRVESYKCAPGHYEIRGRA